MANLLDAVLAYFDESKNRTDEQKAANAIAVINSCQDAAALVALSAVLPGGVINLPVVAAAIDVRTKTLTSVGTAGPYGDIAKGLYEGFKVLAPVMGKAATDTLQSGITTATPAAQALAAGVVDPLVAVMVQGLQAGGKTVPPDVAGRLRGS